MIRLLDIGKMKVKKAYRHSDNHILTGSISSMEKIKVTAPESTQTCTSRYIDSQVLPVDISMNEEFIDFSEGVLDGVKMGDVKR